MCQPVQNRTRQTRKRKELNHNTEEQRWCTNTHRWRRRVAAACPESDRGTVWWSLPSKVLGCHSRGWLQSGCWLQTSGRGEEERIKSLRQTSENGRFCRSSNHQQTSWIPTQEIFYVRNIVFLKKSHFDVKGRTCEVFSCSVTAFCFIFITSNHIRTQPMSDLVSVPLSTSRCHRESTNTRTNSHLRPGVLQFFCICEDQQRTWNVFSSWLWELIQFIHVRLLLKSTLNLLALPEVWGRRVLASEQLCKCVWSTQVKTHILTSPHLLHIFYLTPR